MVRDHRVPSSRSHVRRSLLSVETVSLWLTSQNKYNDPNVDKVTVLRSELDNVREVALQNIDRVLERGERLDGLVERTTLLR